MSLKIRHGKGGEREIVVRWNCKGIADSIDEVTLLFRNPPAGYRGESMTVAKQRNTRGARHDLTVVYYHANRYHQPQDIELLVGVLEGILESERTIREKYLEFFDELRAAESEQDSEEASGEAAEAREAAQRAFRYRGLSGDS